MYSKIVFGKQWFKDKQKTLLWFLNTPYVQLWFRWILRINGKRSSVGKNKIDEILPYAIRWGNVWEFRTHPKFAKRIYYAFKFFWWFLHFWDWAIMDRFELVKQYSFGFDTLPFYPDADVETTTVDGYTFRRQDSTWNNLRNHDTGYAADDSSASLDLWVNTATTTNQYYELYRVIALFDTSSINDAYGIDSATLSLYVTSHSGSLQGNWAMGVTESNPISNTAVTSSDYYVDRFNDTRFASDIDYASLTDSAYNNMAFNADGLAIISKTGITKLAVRWNYDIDNSDPSAVGWNSNAYKYIAIASADKSGTSEDPKLTVVANATTTSTSSTTTSSSTTSTSSSSTSTSSSTTSSTSSSTSSAITSTSTSSTTTSSSTSVTTTSSSTTTTSSSTSVSVTTTISTSSSITTTSSSTTLSTSSSITPLPSLTFTKKSDYIKLTKEH